MSEIYVALAAHDLRSQLGVIAGRPTLALPHRPMRRSRVKRWRRLARMANAVQDSNALLEDLVVACGCGGRTPSA